MQKRSSILMTVAAVAAAGMLAACGTATPTNTPTTTITATPPVTSAGGGDIGFYRVGGVAGFSDQLTLSPDGVVVLQRRGKDVIRCKVKSAPRAQLAQLGAAAGSSTPTSTPTRPDRQVDQIKTGLVVNGVQVPASALSTATDEWRQLLTQMSKLFNDTVALTTSTPASASADSMCDPI